jgi:hypothetical protein
MKKILLVVCVVALLAVASAAYASDSAWYIQIKAVNPTTFGGGAGVTMGVGTSAELAQNFPTTTGSTANAESTAAYGDATSTYHSKHDVLRDTVGTEEYAWDLKIGSRSDYAPSTINICIWNNTLALAGNGGAANASLAYALYKGDALLAWFSTGATQAQFANTYWKVPGLATAKWTDLAVIQKNSSTWSPSSTNQGFFVTDTVTKSEIGKFDDLANYSFKAFGYEAPVVTPEPGSIMALGSGLIGLAGFAIRRRK